MKNLLTVIAILIIHDTFGQANSVGLLDSNRVSSSTISACKTNGRKCAQIGYTEYDEHGNSINEKYLNDQGKVKLERIFEYDSSAVLLHLKVIINASDTVLVDGKEYSDKTDTLSAVLGGIPTIFPKLNII